MNHFVHLTSYLIKVKLGTMKRFFFILFLLVPIITFAQFRGGVGAGYLNAMGDFANTHGAGFNVAALGEYEFSTVSVVAELGYNTFFVKDDLILPIQDVSSVSFTGGVQATLKDPVYIEMRLGYYFGDIDETAAIIAPGLRFDKLDINIGFNVLAPTPFFNLRLGYFLFGE